MNAGRLFPGLVSACVLVLALAPDARGPEPDTVLVNGRVFTASTARPWAQAIAIRGTQVAAVDTTEAISRMAGAATRLVDLGGRVVIPGMLDTHNHYSGRLRGDVTELDLHDWAPPCATVLEAVTREAVHTPSGHLLTGSMGPDAFFDPRCTPAALDAAAPETPVMLTSGTPHGAMLNRAAVQWFGIDTSAPPPLGGWYGKDQNARQWDGVVHESSSLRLMVRLVSPGFDDDARLSAFLREEARYGVTSNTFLEPLPAQRLEQLARVDPLHRVHVVPFAQYEEGPSRRRLVFPAVPPAIADRVSLRGEKWVLDGSPIERSAALRQPYADAPASAGRLDYPAEEIRAILEESLRLDQPLMLHAVGDRSAEVVLEMMERSGGPTVWATRRVRVEHGDGLTDDLIPRAKRLGIVVAQNPMHFVAGDFTSRRFGAERAARWAPFRTLLEARVPIVIASDGGFGEPDLNPFLNIQMATTYPRRPEEAITREQAVIALTRTAAWSEFADDRLGTLEPGKQADLAVLSQDIFSVPVESLPSTESVLTLVGGTVAYTNGSVSLQPPAAR